MSRKVDTCYGCIKVSLTIGEDTNMVNDWMIDVIKDLRDFASKNGLGMTEKLMDQAVLQVSKELASMEGLARGTAHIGHVRELSRTVADGRNS